MDFGFLDRWTRLPRGLCRIVVLCGFAYSVAVTGLGLYPFWRHLGENRALIVAAPGCGLAGSLLASVRASPLVAERILPVIMASNLTRGGETDASAESCAMIAAEIRGHAPWTAVVPRRFLCASVRRYVRARYLERHLPLGGHILVMEDTAHGTWRYAARLLDLGLTWVRREGGFRIVPIEPGSPASPPPARIPGG
ncbi:MAG: hypothetical protein D6705_13780 [Deltaproteobacteria bacterium]|nr:MAG: hypothetical protein D6705_13780 [Deltaproteobacteria bacterium]